MSSALELLVAAFERDNAPLAAPTGAMLADFIADKRLHARFMNTLSMLEHMGSHKIMATQHGLGIDQPTLKHLAEETRHAFFFKRHANREAGRVLEYNAADMVAPLTARRYFQRLEAEMVRAFPAAIHPRAVYLTMSMVIEFRAVWGYRLYQAALVRAGNIVSLKSLLAEENGHLADMAERLAGFGELDRDRLRKFCVIETALYGRLLAAFIETLNYRLAA
ncbi:MAG: hypothetical protein JWM91_2011 [Rhodospirillales bacterium]|nr:hypothetical protein [Rhodospirillales bacterium]